MKKIIFYLFILLNSSHVQSQTRRDTTIVKPDSIPKFVRALGRGEKWLAGYGFELRKTLDGSKNEQSPASITLNNDYEHGFHYFVIDMGIKLLQISLLKKTSLTILTLYPKFEWHKNGIPDDIKKTNTLAGGLNVEFLHPLGDDHWWQKPYLTASFDYKNDLVKQLNTTQTKAYLTFNGDNDFNPGGLTRNKAGAFKLRYYPYTGIEYYYGINKNNQSATIWANRFYMEYYPISTLLYQYVQFTFDYTHRSIIKDNVYNQGDLDWLTLGLNFYPDGKGNIGLGLTYSKGEDPSSNFVKMNMLALGIKLKI